MTSKNKGITLVALVITIIVLLILSGIVIVLTIGENGIIQKAKQSGQTYSQQEAREKLELVLFDMQSEKIINSQYNQDDYLTKKIEENNMIVNGDIVKVNNWSFEINRSVPEIIGIIDNNQILTPLNILLSYSLKENNNNVSKEKLNVLKDNTNKSVDANMPEVEISSDKTGIIFDGSSSYSKLDSSKLNISFPATITIAVKWEENTNVNMIFTDYNSKIGIGTYKNQYLVLDNKAGQVLYYPLPKDFYNNINYITAIYESVNNSKLYINGEKIEGQYIGSYGWNLSEANTYLGRRNNGDYFKGTLYDFKIYEKEFSEQEVKESYKNTKEWLEQNKTFENQQKQYMILDYTIKDNSNNQTILVPDILKDSSKNGNDITINNGKYNGDKTGIIFNGTTTYGKYSNLIVGFPATISIIMENEEDTVQTSNLIFTDYNSKIGIGLLQNKWMILENERSGVLYYPLPKGFYQNSINYITVAYENINTKKLYINGEKIETVQTGDGWNLSEANTYLGRRNNGSYLKGTLYKFEIYNELLTEQQILDQYEKDKKIY